MNGIRKALLITWKDVLSEIRTREIISSVLLFSILVVVIMNFAFSGGREEILPIAPGILWITFSFAGIISLNHSFMMEKQESCIEGLLVCPVSREMIYTGKMTGNLIFMLIIELITMPVFSVLFNISVFQPEVVLIVFLTTVGFASVGTLFSAMAVNTRAKEMVLPILFFPVVAPLIISAVNATGVILNGDSWSGINSWLIMIIAFDVVFLVTSYLIFGYIIEE